MAEPSGTPPAPEGAPPAPAPTPAAPGTPAAASQAGSAAPAKPHRPARAPHPGGIRIPKSTLDKIGWTLVLFATLAVIVLGFFLFSLITIDYGSEVTLAEAYVHPNDEFSIRPPMNWVIEDDLSITAADRNLSMIVKGPRERGFPPMLSVSLDKGPGRLESYLKEHKGRLQAQSKSLVFLSEDEDWVDGCHSVRLVYECDLETDEQTTVKVRTLQFILDDHPRFYAVTAWCAAATFDKYLKKFETSARTLQRLPLKSKPPQFLKN